MDRQRLTMRFEGPPGEFSQHDFGKVKVRYLDGDEEKVHYGVGERECPAGVLPNGFSEKQRVVEAREERDYVLAQ